MWWVCCLKCLQYYEDYTQDLFCWCDWNMLNSQFMKISFHIQRVFYTLRRGAWYPPTFVQQPLASSPDNSLNNSQNASNVAFAVLSWSMTRHDTQDLTRPDPRPELDTPSHQALENTLAMSDCRRDLLLKWASQIHKAICIGYIPNCYCHKCY